MVYTDRELLQVSTVGSETEIKIWYGADPMRCSVLRMQPEAVADLILQLAGSLARQTRTANEELKKWVEA
jgi:hypothetical protein